MFFNTNIRQSQLYKIYATFLSEQKTKTMDMSVLSPSTWPGDAPLHMLQVRLPPSHPYQRALPRVITTAWPYRIATFQVNVAEGSEKRITIRRNFNARAN